MSTMRKLPGFPRAPAGLDRTLLRTLPMIAIAGTALPVGGALGAVYFPGSDPASAKLVVSVEIALASVLLSHWMVVFMKGLLSLIVLIAKGPAHVADAYPLIDSDRPAQ